MPKLHPYQEFYSHACSFLKEHLPQGVSKKSLNRYFSGDGVKSKNMKDVFERFVSSAQNYQSMPNVIKFDERKAEIKKILFDYDLTKIADNWVAESLYRCFRKRFKVTSSDSKQNSWYKWSCSIVDSAKFLKDFKDIEEFKQFVGRFNFNVHTRMALPLLMSKKIKGIGFALACDALKELGFVEYPKPDVHLMDVFSELEMCGRDQTEVFEMVVKISNKCREIDKTVTPYKVDKILWLICSGRYYFNDIETKPLKKEFIKSFSR